MLKHDISTGFIVISLLCISTNELTIKKITSGVIIVWWIFLQKIPTFKMHNATIKMNTTLLSYEYECWFSKTLGSKKKIVTFN